MALSACRHCGHYYVTEGEVREPTCCAYCEGEMRPADAGEAHRYVRRLLHTMHETAKGWVSGSTTRTRWGTAVWTSTDDGARYRELTRDILATMARRAGAQSLAQVEVEDLAAYLEWFELAREAAPTLRPFILKSAPDALEHFTYRQMKKDFAWLRAQLTEARRAGAVL